MSDEACVDCEACRELLVDGGSLAEAGGRIPEGRGARKGRRRRTPCGTCGHPLGLHRPPADAPQPVVGAPLPADLPPMTAPPRLVPSLSDPGPVTDRTAPDPAHDGPETFVDRLRTLTELYQAGSLDSDEFAAAKQALLRRLSG